jgi:hypothetical protein
VPLLLHEIFDVVQWVRHEKTRPVAGLWTRIELEVDTACSRSAAQAIEQLVGFDTSLACGQFVIVQAGQLFQRRFEAHQATVQFEQGVLHVVQFIGLGVLGWLMARHEYS